MQEAFSFKRLFILCVIRVKQLSHKLAVAKGHRQKEHIKHKSFSHNWDSLRGHIFSSVEKMSDAKKKNKRSVSFLRNSIFPFRFLYGPVNENPKQIN